MIGLLGAVAVWCDVNESTFTIDPDSVKSVLSDKTAAIIAVHLYGQCADIEALENVAPEQRFLMPQYRRIVHKDVRL